jgi:hypothetical protein
LQQYIYGLQTSPWHHKHIGFGQNINNVYFATTTLRRKDECHAFKINAENDAHHTLGSTASNRALFVHCQTFYLSQCLVVCLAYFHHAFDEH